MKYKVGDKVRIQPLEWYQKELESAEYYLNIFDIYWCSREMTISKIEKSKYLMEEDGQEFYWIDDMIEGLVEEPVLSAPNITVGVFIHEKDMKWTTEYILPEGYQFIDENGNVINATKIVLEKKKKDVSLTQEQINKMVHDSCVLFCKHCGCGIPRDTCTSLGTCKEHDEYRDAIRTHLMEKKKEYPKTYQECCEVLGIDALGHNVDGYKWEILATFQNLLICRDAYWKIAGEEMGLGKPWKPDWTTNDVKHSLVNVGNTMIPSVECKVCRILTFPTKEMRNAFYENFKEEIEKCKELL